MLFGPSGRNGNDSCRYGNDSNCATGEMALKRLQPIFRSCRFFDALLFSLQFHEFLQKGDAFMFPFRSLLVFFSMTTISVVELR